MELLILLPRHSPLATFKFVGDRIRPKVSQELESHPVLFL